MDVREKLVELIGSTEYGNGSLVESNFQKGFIEKIASHLIANGVTVQEWISVKDRLPREDGYYLVTINYFGDRQCIDIRCFAKDGETVDEYDLAGQKYVWYFYDSEYGHVSTDFVTHWMPLPEPPKGE